MLIIYHILPDSDGSLQQNFNQTFVISYLLMGYLATLQHQLLFPHI
jgi:hypothetical protein